MLSQCVWSAAATPGHGPYALPIAPDIQTVPLEVGLLPARHKIALAHFSHGGLEFLEHYVWCRWSMVDSLQQNTDAKIFHFKQVQLGDTIVPGLKLAILQNKAGTVQEIAPPQLEGVGDKGADDANLKALQEEQLQRGFGSAVVQGGHNLTECHCQRGRHHVVDRQCPK